MIGILFLLCALAAHVIPHLVKRGILHRRMLQLHLSTCIVLMFVAGFLLHANLTPHTRPLVFVSPSLIGGSPVVMVFQGQSMIGYGWPHPEMARDFSNFIPGATLERLGVSSTWQMDYRALGWNILCALAILAVTALFCEWRIRRKERPPDGASKPADDAATIGEGRP